MNYEPAIAHLRAADPILAALIDQVGPCEFIPTGHSFQTLVDAIVSQQISVQAAAAIMQRLIRLLGEVSPERISAVSVEELRAVGLSGQKTRYLHDLAEHAITGQLNLAALPDLPDDEVISQLVAVKGIGRWTAEIYLMFALGRLDVLPADDLGLRYAIQQFYALEAAPPKVIRELGEIWRPYRSIASWYLWRARRVIPL